MQRIDEYQPRGTEVSWQEALDTFEQRSHGGKHRVTPEGIDQMHEDVLAFESRLVVGVPVLHTDSTFPNSTAGFAPEQPITGYVGSVEAYLVGNLADAHKGKLNSDPYIDGAEPEITDYEKMKKAWDYVAGAGWANPPQQFKEEIAHYSIGKDAIEAKLPELVPRRQLASLVVLKAAGIEVGYQMADEHIEKAQALLKNRLATFAFLSLDHSTGNYSGIDLIKTNAVVNVPAEELRQGATEYLDKYFRDKCGVGTLRRAAVDASIEWLIDKMDSKQPAEV